VGLVSRSGFTDLVSLMPGVTPVRWQAAPRAVRLFCYDAGDRSTFTSLWCRAQTKTLLTFSEFYRRFYHSWIFDETRLHEQGQNYRARYLWSITPGAEGVFEPPRLHAPPQEWSHPDIPRQPFILVHPTSAWQRKCWSARSWHEVLIRLRSAGMPVVLTGGASEWERGLCAEIAVENTEVLNLGGKTNLRQIIAAASQAALVMTVDGFMSHLALAYRKPCVTLFGPTNANHWHLGTEWSEAVYDGGDPAAKNKSLDAVPAERVVERVNRWLEKLSPAPASPLHAPSADS
jgi:ADP-heptose:LPS heptosyltransferase